MYHSDLTHCIPLVTTLAHDWVCDANSNSQNSRTFASLIWNTVKPSRATVDWLCHYVGKNHLDDKANREKAQQKGMSSGHWQLLVMQI